MKIHVMGFFRTNGEYTGGGPLVPTRHIILGGVKDPGQLRLGIPDSARIYEIPSNVAGLKQELALAARCHGMVLLVSDDTVQGEEAPSAEDVVCPSCGANVRVGPVPEDGVQTQVIPCFECGCSSRILVGFDVDLKKQDPLNDRWLVVRWFRDEWAEGPDAELWLACVRADDDDLTPPLS